MKVVVVKAELLIRMEKPYSQQQQSLGRLPSQTQLQKHETATIA